MPILTGEETSGIVSASPTTPPVATVPVITITSPNYSTVAIDTRWTPVNTILQHVEGSAWTIDYYSQILTKDSQLSGQQTTVSAPYQQYNKITKLEVRVTSPLAQSQDAETKAITYVGTALVYSMLIPNEGDMFVADIGDGQKAIFRITATTKKSVFKKATYEVSYTITTTDPAFIADLESKVINTFVFRKDFLTHGQNPIVISTDNNILEALQGTYETLAKQYFPRYFNREFQTFIIPGQAFSVYDPFLTSYLVKMFNNDESHLLQHVRELNVQDDPIMTQNNFWTALFNKEISYLNTGFTRVGLMSTQTFGYDPFVNPIRYTGIEYCVYPLNPIANINSEHTALPKLISPVTLVEVTGGTNTMELNTNLANLPATGVPSVYPVLRDDYYVLGADFYNQTTTQSVLEDAVSNYLLGDALDINSLSNTAKLFTRWGMLEQFYYVPILLTLIRGTIREYRG